MSEPFAMTEYKRNHYVPKWYQYRFFPNTSEEKKFHYLDLKPESCKTEIGEYKRSAILRWGPKRCFYSDDLYTTKFGDFESTEIEQKFFGKIDDEGKKAVEYFSSYNHSRIDHDAFHALMLYMSTQKLRTPKGIEQLSLLTGLRDKNRILFALQHLQNMYCALWTECVWSIVDASNSATKFLISDHPVTAFNKKFFPGSSVCRNGMDPATSLSGTHTIFPLSLDKALVLTNLNWIRNPYGSPAKKRPNAELFRSAMFKFTDIQVGRLLEEREVIQINHIIKQRSFRYVASANKEWLFPEKQMLLPRWDKIGDSYLLMPDPRSITFSTEIVIGYNDGSTDHFDEYGRKPWHGDYADRTRKDKEWESFQAFKGEYARLFGPRRRGVSFELGCLEDKVDSDDYHKHHLSLEAKFKRRK